MKRLGTNVAGALRKAFGRELDIVHGPYTPLPLGGLRPTLFMAVTSFVDHGGVTADGARIGRTPMTDSNVPGYVEERPGRVAVIVDCVALAHASVQQTCTTAAPVALAALASLTSLSFGETQDGSCTLEFREFSVCLHSLAFRVEPDKDRPYARGTIEFHLDGFLRMQLRRKKMRGLPKAKRRR